MNFSFLVPVSLHYSQVDL